MSLPNKGIVAFYAGVDSTAHLYRRNQDMPLEYPKFLFQLDFYNFSVLIPMLADNEEGNFKIIMPKVKVVKSIDCIDFTKEEEKFYCEFSAEKIEISKEAYEDIEEKLRKQRRRIEKYLSF